MAVYHGKAGKILDGVVPIISFTSWTIDAALDTVEATDFGDTAKIFTAGIYGWTGSFEGHGSPENTEQAALLAALVGGSLLTDITFYIDATHYFDGDIIITGMSHTATITDILKVSCTFQGSGVLAYN